MSLFNISSSQVYTVITVFIALFVITKVGKLVRILFGILILAAIAFNILR